jgi:putative PEP-CTERM system TPR-repeat lipoprotein
LPAARDALAKGDVRTAIVHLKNAVQDDPASAEARLLLGGAYVRVADYPSAEKELKLALDNGADSKDVLPLLGQTYLRQGKFDELLDRVLPADRGVQVESQILAMRAFAHMGKQELDKAESALRQAIALEPTSGQARLGLAMLYRQRGDSAAAETEIDAVIAMDDDNAEALNLKGELRRRSGDREGALAAFEKAVAADGNNLMARLGRAAIYVAENENVKAQADLDVVLKRAAAHPVANYLSALMQAKAGRDQEALATLLKSGELLNGYPAGLYLLSYLNVRLNQLEQAETNLRRLLGLTDDLNARKLLASVYLRKGSADKAIEQLKGLEDDPTLDVQALSLLANAYLRSGKSAEAAELLKRLMTEDPDNAELRTQFALSQIQGGDSAEAVKELEDVIKAEPGSQQAHILLVLTHLRENRLDQAIAAANELKKNMSNVPLPDNLLGGIYARKGDIAQARASFESALKLDSKFVPALLNLAQLDVAQGNRKDAVARYEQALGIDGANVAAMMALSRIAFAEDNQKVGVEWLKKAIQAQPQALQPRLRLVDYYLATKDNSGAMVAARELSQLHPQNLLAIDALGRAQFASGQPASAVTAFRRIVGLAPKSPAAHQRLAQALIEIKNFGEARRTLETAIELQPTFAPAHLILIGMDVAQDNIEGALASADRLAAATPKSAISDSARGDIYMRAKRYEEAAAAYRAGLQKEPGTNLAINLYRAHLAKGERDKGMDELRGWLKRNPNDNVARFALASALLDGGQLDAATQEHEALLANKADNQVVLNNLAWLYDQKGDPRSIELAEKAYQLAPKSPAIKDTLGWILVRRGDPKRALELLRSASEELPNNAEVQYHYGAALAKGGQNDQARRVLELAINSGQKFGAIEDARALLKTLN